ncbi:MAG: glycosyltransferase family 2 protein [Chloroflexi bacterium]|nr:glycosyltransferase family 2 protein [Chloroflexota bacterium]MCL5076417.1 glycosyltransferase family 2 protein [Chloroflexota bacterium]
MKVSVIIPVYNEAKHIGEVIERVRAIDIPKEIIVVDDGSTDGTRAVLENYKGYEDITIHLCEKNGGKGAAIREGLGYVTGDIVILQDADLEYDPIEYPKLVRPIVQGEASVVYGSRFKGRIEGMRFANWLANKILALAVLLLYGAKISDEATCYKVFDKEVIKSFRIRANRFDICPEVTAKVLKRGHRIFEVPITYRARSVAEGKKITWKDGWQALWTLIKFRFIE